MKIQTTNDNQKSKHTKILKAIVWVFIIATSYLSVAAAYRSGTETDLKPSETALREKIEAYKQFKRDYEDKDFQLDSYPLRRVEHINGKSKTSTFEIYRITYGQVADNSKEYDKSRKQFVKNPNNSLTGKKTVCPTGLYMEDYTESRMHPNVMCSEDVEHSYPISLILKTLSKDELPEIAIIYEFNDGDLDIQFDLDKGRNKELVEKLYKKLQLTDEKNDEKRKAVIMEPIFPTRNQRLTPTYVDEDKDGDPEFVLVPYCIDGSFFDDDPGNDSVQVAFKYKLVTKKDLAGKTFEERKMLEKRLGLWMWDKPSEILTSFSENPGPDIAFSDIGKVMNNEIIDPTPDGNFDKYEFLY
jgi:hypothetical protein